MKKVKCDYCGKEFERRGVLERNFCSAACRVAWHRKQKGYPKTEHVCVLCGKTFQRTKGYKPKELYCDECSQAKQKEESARRMETRICERCGKEFKTARKYQPKHNYCSECKAERRRERNAPKVPDLVSVVCSYCGETFLRRRDRVRPRNYCSSACKAAYTRAKMDRTLVTLECEHCGRRFERPARFVEEYNYCSKACRAERVVVLTCDYCGKTFERKGRHVHEHNYCSDECRRAANRPERAYHLDISEERREAIRERNRNFEWTEESRERARRAQLTNGEERGHSADAYAKMKVEGKTVQVHRVVAEQILGRPLRDDEVVHHIDHNKRNNSPENLRIMSAEEHGRLHFEEDQDT